MYEFYEVLQKVGKYRLKNKTQRIDLKQVTPLELKAMRYLRGAKPNEFSRTIGISMDKMLRIENSKEDTAPEKIATRYIVALDIMPNEHMKLKALLKGETNRYIHSRTIPTHIKKKVRKKCDNKCVNCGEKENLHFHHIKRFSRGGQHTVDNLILLCASCHIEEHKGETVYNAMNAKYG